MKYRFSQFLRSGARMQLMEKRYYDDYKACVMGDLESSLELNTDGNINCDCPLWVLDSVPETTLNYNQDNLCYGYHTGYRFEIYTDDGLFSNCEFGRIVSVCKTKYRFIDTIPLCEEVEFQCDNGDLHYAYIGPNYLAIWERVEYPSEQEFGLDEKNLLCELLADWYENQNCPLYRLKSEINFGAVQLETVQAVRDKILLDRNITGSDFHTLIHLLTLMIRDITEDKNDD